MLPLSKLSAVSTSFNGYGKLLNMGLGFAFTLLMPSWS